MSGTIGGTSELSLCNNRKLIENDGYLHCITNITEAVMMMFFFILHYSLFKKQITSFLYLTKFDLFVVTIQIN